MPEQPQDPSSANEVQPANLLALLPSTSVVSKRAQGALGLLREVVQESSAEYWHKCGNVAKEANNWSEAEVCFKRSMQLDSNRWRLFLRLAVTSVTKKDLDLARFLLLAFGEQCISGKTFIAELSLDEWGLIRIELENRKDYNEEFFINWLALALIYQVTLGNSRTRPFLNKIKNTFPDEVEKSACWHYLSAVHWQDYGNFPDALNDYNRVILLDPTNPKPYFDRGFVKEELGNSSSATEDYERAILLCPSLRQEFADAFADRAFSRQEDDDYQGALDDFNRAINLYPNFGEYYFHRSIIKYQMDDRDGAIADSKTANSLDPSFGEINFE